MSREGYHGNSGVLNQPNTHVITATQDLENARREGLLSNLAKFQSRIGRIGAILADDHVSRNDGLEYFDAHYTYWQIPRADGTDDSHWEIPPDCQDGSIVLEDFLRNFQSHCYTKMLVGLSRVKEAEKR